jgi:hypothetical protein
MQKDQELYLWESFKNLFKPKRVIKRGDVGVYQDVLNINTLNDGTHSMNYDMYIKVRAVAVYQNLVEIEVIDVMTTNSHHNEVKDLVQANIPKYIKPKYVKWEISGDTPQLPTLKEVVDPLEKPTQN